MALDRRVVDRFHKVLVEEIRRTRPEYLEKPFTVAEIYQSLVPYRSHRDRIGVEMNADYEEALLHLLGGNEEYLVLDSQAARDRIRRELAASNPNTGVFRDFAALTVRLDSGKAEKVPAMSLLPGSGAEPGPGERSEAGTLFAHAPEPRREGTPGEEAARDQGAASADPAVPAPTDSDSSAPVSSDCPDCGRDLPARPGLRFCPYCGVDVLMSACAACGEELDREWAFCVACGTPSGFGAGAVG
ncbi:hypothetical protein BH23GEM11_BH23GEM11_15080 [soil metagenome]